VNAGGSLAPTNCAFDLPLFLPAANVQDLGGSSTNLRFQDIDILGGNLNSGEVDLNVIGVNTSKLRYVFSATFTVAQGATLKVASGLPVLINPNVTVTDNGTLILSTNDQVTFGSNNGVIVNAVAARSAAMFDRMPKVTSTASQIRPARVTKNGTWTACFCCDA